MNIFLKIALGGAAALSLVITLAIGRSAAPEPPPIIAADPPPSMDDTYREIALSVLRQSAEEPKPVVVEKIIPPIIPMVNVAKSRPVEASVKEQKKAENDICTRNGRRKVWISRFKWRCKK